MHYKTYLAFLVLASCSACKKEEPAKNCDMSLYGDSIRDMVNDASEKAIRLGFDADLNSDQKNVLASSENYVRRQSIWKIKLVNLDYYDKETGNLKCVASVNYQIPSGVDRKLMRRIHNEMTKSNDIPIGDDIFDPQGETSFKFGLSDNPQLNKGNLQIVSSDDLGPLISYQILLILAKAEQISNDSEKDVKKRIQFHFS